MLQITDYWNVVHEVPGYGRRPIEGLYTVKSRRQVDNTLEDLQLRWYDHVKVHFVIGCPYMGPRLLIDEGVDYGIHLWTEVVEVSS